MSMMHVPSPSFFSAGTMPSGAATSVIVRPPAAAAQFDSQFVPPPPSISVSGPSSFSVVVTTSGRERDLYISSATARQLDDAGSGVGGPLMHAAYDVTPARAPSALAYFTSSSYGVETSFGPECGSGMTGPALHDASATTQAASVCDEDTPQSSTHHLDARGGSNVGFAATMPVTADSGGSGLYPLAEPGPDTALQPIIYRRPFTSAKPPYSYISLITMAIQVGRAAR